MSPPSTPIVRPTEAPITEDDAFITRALESASIPTLMMSMIHMSGDTSLLDGDIRPGAATLGESQGGLTPEQKAEVRRRALDIIVRHRDGGGDLPPPPSPETIHRMMSFMVGAEVPDAYVPMMLEELSVEGRDSRGVEWGDVDPEARAKFPVLIIGAGMSGLLTAIRLEQAGIPYTIIEKNDAVGGTWYENQYPGCRVDVANHFYCYSFEPNSDWSEHFSQRDELQAYFERCATKYGVREHIRFETEVLSLRFDEDESEWVARVRDAAGVEDSLRVSAVVSAVGQLNRPKLPAIEGVDTFQGPAFHSANWDTDFDAHEKRVAVVGTGASAFQLVPELAKQTQELLVFQRSAPWMLPNPGYHSAVSEGKKWLLRHIPYYGRWYRFMLFWPGSDGLMPSLIVDPDWPHPERSVNALNEATRVAFVEYMAHLVGDDPELLEQVTPTYPPFGKRILQDNGSWLTTLKRDDVHLVTDPIARITTDSIVCESGQEHPVDAIVFATGFHANRFLWPIQVTGRDGVELSELWGDDPRAYLGITVPRFPNLFCLYGPGTNLAHAGSIIFHSECQVRYITACIKALLTRGAKALECKEEINEAFNRRLDETASKTVWAHPGMTSWYKNAKGRMTTTSPWLLVDYWGWTREPDLEDFELT